MITELKKQLLKNPKAIEKLLIKYDFHNINVGTKEIRCGREENSNKTSIRIKLIDNDNLYVKDFARGINCDLISFIMQTRNVDFKTVIKSIKHELGIGEDYLYTKKVSIFGGFYDKIKPRHSDNIELKIYDESILEQYIDAYSLKFLKDNISFEAQKFFNVRIDAESQRIVFPIRDWAGNIIGIKGRANWKVTDDEPKYLYLIPCRVSQTLFGYSQNYSYLCDNIVIICESEKSVMQAYSYGYRNVVALGSNSISINQCKLIMSLQPKEIIFALDESLDLEITKNNIEKLKLFTRMSDVKIKYWDWRNSKYVKERSKDSITDNGKEVFERILSEEVKLFE